MSVTLRTAIYVISEPVEFAYVNEVVAVVASVVLLAICPQTICARGEANSLEWERFMGTPR